jgi:beta-phosphoglucomutase
MMPFRIFFAALFAAATLSGCNAGNPPPGDSPDDYVSALQAARTAKDEAFRRQPNQPVPPDKMGEFLPLKYFPPDPAYLAPASLKTAQERVIVEMPTSTGKIRQQHRVGVLEFTLKGKALTLGAFVEAGADVNRLFVPFSDMTSGTETYSAGRYLELDSEPIHLRAYQSVLKADGIDLDRKDYYERYLGYDDVGLFQALAGDRGVKTDAAKIDGWISAKARYVEEMLSNRSVLFQGAADCVRMFAARVPLAIASGALEPEIAIVLEHAGLRESFEGIASASDGVPGKPAPDLYLLAIKKLQQQLTKRSLGSSIDPSMCIAIEDSHWGLEAAAKAGLRTVAVTHTYRAAELGRADLIVERLSDLTISNVEAALRHNGRAG